jgi:predicted MFS family arabinose efflux permease
MLLVDALSFLFSALLLGSIRPLGANISEMPSDEEPLVKPASEEPLSIWRDMGAGLQAIRQRPILRALLIPLAMRNFFGNFFAPLYALHVIQDVGLSAALMGLTIGAGGLGALPATFLTARIAAALGVGRTMIIARFVSATLGFLIPLAAGWDAAWIGLVLLLIPQLIGDFFGTIHDILAISIRQSAAPEAMLGRVNAGFEVVLGGCGTVGILVGGLLGSAIGMQSALFIAVVGILLSAILLARSPIAKLKELTD